LLPELNPPNPLVVDDPNRLLLPVFVLLPNIPDEVPVPEEPNKPEPLPEPKVDVDLLPKSPPLPNVDPLPNVEDEPNICLELVAST